MEKFLGGVRPDLGAKVEGGQGRVNAQGREDEVSLGPLLGHVEVEGLGEVGDPFPQGLGGHPQLGGAGLGCGLWREELEDQQEEEREEGPAGRHGQCYNSSRPAPSGGTGLEELCGTERAGAGGAVRDRESWSWRSCQGQR